LASDPADYAAYVAAIRAEYARVPEEQFLAGRLAVLTGLANREIFRTSKGRQLTDAAYANLETEISALLSNGSLRPQ
jgi:predicted metal-dependent HD superfamily phosphohydrolase